MTTPSKFPQRLLFGDDGHLTDVALTAIADGQNLLDEEALAHFEACETCALGVGEAALLSLELHDDLKAAASLALARKPVPVFALALAFVSVLVTALPALYTLSRHPLAPLREGAGVLVVMGQLAAIASRGSDELARAHVMGAIGSGMLMLIIGLAVARTQSQPAWK